MSKVLESLVNLSNNHEDFCIKSMDILKSALGVYDELIEKLE